MISKIIQKEKERQENILRITDNNYLILSHKISLINLKEYMEELVEKLNSRGGCSNSDWAWKIESEDIEELTKMIEAYK